MARNKSLEIFALAVGAAVLASQASPAQDKNSSADWTTIISQQGDALGRSAAPGVPTQVSPSTSPSLAAKTAASAPASAPAAVRQTGVDVVTQKTPTERFSVKEARDAPGKDIVKKGGAVEASGDGGGVLVDSKGRRFELSPLSAERCPEIREGFWVAKRRADSFEMTLSQGGHSCLDSISSSRYSY